MDSRRGGGLFDMMRERLYGDGPGGLQIADLFPEEEGLVDEEFPNPVDVGGLEDYSELPEEGADPMGEVGPGEPGQMAEGLREELLRRAQERAGNTDQFQKKIAQSNRQGGKGY